MKGKGAEIFLPELTMSLDSLRLHLFNNYNIKIEQMNHKMQTGGTADSAMSNDPMIGGTMASSMARGGKIGVGDYVKAKPMYGNISGEVTFANDNIVVIKNPIGKTFMFHPHDLMKTMGKGGKIDIGDTVHIVDNKSMFKGKSGVVLSQLTPTTVIVQIVVDGNDRNVVVRKSGLEYIENLEEGGSMTADDVYSYDTQDGEIMGNGGGVGDFDGSGLVVVGRTQIDNNKIRDFVEDSGYYGVWNAREGYWFFQEDKDSVDELEMELSEEFNKLDIDARFEYQEYKHGGKMLKGGVLGDIYSIESSNQFQQLITTYNELSEKFGVVNYFLDHNDNSVVFLMKEDEQINTMNLQKYVNSLSKRGFDVFDKSQNKSVVIKADNSQGGGYVYFKLKLSKIVRYANGGGVGDVWIALSKTKDGLLLSEIFESQMTNKQLFDYYKKKGYVIIDSNIFKVTNKSVVDAFKDAVSKYIQEKYNESVDWQNTLLSYQIVGDRVVAQSCWVQTKNGNEYEVTPSDLVNKKYAKGGATPAQKRKIGKVMHEWKERELNIGKSDKKVKSQKQAVAIALSQAGLSKKEEGGKMMGWKHKRK